MDPNQALIELAQALYDNDLSAALERAQALDYWTRRGGFMPKCSDAILGVMIQGLVTSLESLNLEELQS